jgi:hypothetical protein
LVALLPQLSRRLFLAAGANLPHSHDLVGGASHYEQAELRKQRGNLFNYM